MSRHASIWVRETLAIAGKEWRTELRTRYALNTIGLFAFSTLVVVSLALGPIGTSGDGPNVLAVVLWLILLFASSAGLPRSFVQEEEIGTAAALRLTAQPSCLFCGKLLYNLALLGLLELIVVPLYLAMLQVPVSSVPKLLGALAVGGYGLAVGSTLIAAMVAQARARGALFSVLAFPVLLPLLLFAIQLTRSAVLGEPGNAALMQTLLYDGTLTVAALMLFPVVWNP